MTSYTGYDEGNNRRTYDNGVIMKDERNCLHHRIRLEIKKRAREITTVQTSI